MALVEGCTRFNWPSLGQLEIARETSCLLPVHFAFPQLYTIFLKKRVPNESRKFSLNIPRDVELSNNEDINGGEGIFSNIPLNENPTKPKMPDVSRSDSNRSDASRPRVSFNRNVHVKRINAPKKVNAYSLSMNGTTFVPTPIWRERPMTKKEITDEAETVLKHVDRVDSMARASKTIAKTEDEEQKLKKKKKRTFSFLSKSEPSRKIEKTKTASSDVESSSSQEYRIYKINEPTTAKSSTYNKIGNGQLLNEEQNQTQKIKNNYDFMSLDRKTLKKKIKKGELDYLSLEKSNAIVDKMKKEKTNRSLLNVVLDRIDAKGKKSGGQFPMEKKTEVGESQMKTQDASNDKQLIKKNITQISENFGVDYSGTKNKNGTEKMVKKFDEIDNRESFAKNTEKDGLVERGNNTCFDENGLLAYANEDKSNFKWKSEKRDAEDLGVRKDDSKSTSPTSDVIYAQVLVGKREFNIPNSTVNERVSRNEVASVVGGEHSNPSQTKISYNINISSKDDVYEINSVKDDESLKKKSLKNTKMSSEFYENNSGLREAGNENGHGASNQTGNEHTRVVKVNSKNYMTKKNGNKSPADLHDLSIRREILISRSESQAKERFNSLKRLQQPTKSRKNISTTNYAKPADKPQRNETRFSEDEVKNNESKHEEHNSSRKKREEEVVSNANRKIEPKKKKESKLDEFWKNTDKVHLIKTDDDDGNLLRKLSRFGKSKSFEQERSKNKKPGKMKMFFSKKNGKSSESEEDPVAARYVEYRGSDVEFSDKSTDLTSRRPTPKDNLPRPMEPWNFLNQSTNFQKSTNFRYFGDTDQESTTNDTYLPETKIKSDLYQNKNFTDTDEDPMLSTRSDSRTTNSTRKGSPTGKFKNKCDLDNPDYGVKQMNHGLNLTFNKYENFSSNYTEPYAAKNDFCNINGLKYEPGVKRSVSSLTNSTKYTTKEKLRNLQSTPIITVKSPDEPLSRRVKSYGNLYNQEDKKKGRRRLYDSSAESATEGDSSQNSSKSMIYLHAARVGDIPGPRSIYKINKRSQSREELSSIEDNSTLMPSGKKTLSRSFSVLAPWRPRHNKDKVLQYDTVDFNKNKPPTGIGKNKINSAREKKATELKFNTLGKENRRRKDLLR